MSQKCRSNSFLFLPGMLLFCFCLLLNFIPSTVYNAYMWLTLAAHSLRWFKEAMVFFFWTFCYGSFRHGLTWKQVVSQERSMVSKCVCVCAVNCCAACLLWYRSLPAYPNVAFSHHQWLTNTCTHTDVHLSCPGLRWAYQQSNSPHNWSAAKSLTTTESQSHTHSTRA